ncbi:DNA polymerase-3 subunit delta' [Oikeobacillus pervagus]|uniref:DNA polymerase III subunit delta' n=1 Tax=Oikeobacillus pervagus TaxID=1325931 RepID=A0AAJ1T3S3_9BACI|nr:DNA polymerase III subunit delta' [Oikeobacillus pervagus]MDQ0216217.1 DNA polymerase-3 subunit delta' [Oikeobacillus pervagus]
MTRNWDEMKKAQPTVLHMIANSINKNRVAHAYLFEGEKGTGKMDVALLFAKSMFCLQPVRQLFPCEQCVNCKRIDHHNHPDLHVIEPDGQSIKKHQINDLQKEFSKSSVESNKKMYIINHADKMTNNAANSLLKFLEEPNSNTTAILITEQIHKMLPTILSRCQVIAFQTLPPHILQKRLLEEDVHPSMATLTSRITNNYQEALLLSQDEWFAQARIIMLKLYEALQKSPLEAMLKLQEEFFGHFKDKQQVDRALDLLLLIYKDLLILQLGKKESLAFPDQQALFEKTVLQLSLNRLSEQLTYILESKRKLHGNMNLHLLMEQLVLKLQGGSSCV